MEMELEQALEEQEQVYLAFPVCLVQVYLTVVPFCRLCLDHMTDPHILPEQGMALQQPGDKHQELKLPVRGMVEPARSQHTSDPVDTREGRRATAFVPYKDIAARMPLAVSTDRSLALVVQQQEGRR